jgi:hypothetical protein
MPQNIDKVNIFYLQVLRFLMLHDRLYEKSCPLKKKDWQHSQGTLLAATLEYPLLLHESVNGPSWFEVLLSVAEIVFKITVVLINVLPTG